MMPRIRKTTRFPRMDPRTVAEKTKGKVIYLGLCTVFDEGD
jgi:hypothetical protein